MASMLYSIPEQSESRLSAGSKAAHDYVNGNYHSPMPQSGPQNLQVASKKSSKKPKSQKRASPKVNGRNQAVKRYLLRQFGVTPKSDLKSRISEPLLIRSDSIRSTESFARQFDQRGHSLRRSKSIRSIRTAGPSSAMPSSPESSPIMLVRRRTPTTNSRGSPVSRFFRRLLKRKPRPTFNFSQAELQRKLSFEIKESADRFSRYKVKSIDFFRLRPKLKKMAINTSKLPVVEPPRRFEDRDENGRPMSIRSSIVRPPQSARQDSAKTDDIESSAAIESEFANFDYDYREQRLRRELSQLNQDPAEAARKRDKILETVERRVMSPEGSPKRVRSVRYDTQNPESSSRAANETRASRHRSQRSHRSHRSQRSAVTSTPVIRRIDLYDTDPTADLDSPVKVDEAMAFVETWSTYLRRAIAIRVVLRQEIHSLEALEDQEYYGDTPSLHSGASSSFSGSSFSSRSDQSGRDDASASASTSSPRSDHYHFSPSIRSASLRSSSIGSAHASDFKDRVTRPDRPVSGGAMATATTTHDAVAVSDVHQRLASGDLERKYTALMTREDGFFPPDQAQLLVAKRQASDPLSHSAPYPLSPPQGPGISPRSSSDSFVTLTKPGQEAMWLRKLKSSSEKPLPTLPSPPVSEAHLVRMSAPISGDGGDSGWHSSDSNDRALREMYLELEQIQASESQDDLGYSRRDSGISMAETKPPAVLLPGQPNQKHQQHRRGVSYSSIETESSADLSHDLRRGALNRRRRPRSALFKQDDPYFADMSPLTQQAAVQPRERPSRATISQRQSERYSMQSSDTGFTFDGEPTQWTRAMGRRAMVVQVGDEPVYL